MTKSGLKPIFVVGTGRSGSTIFHKMLCMHPDVAWVNRILVEHPSRIGLHRAYLNMVDLPVVGDWLLRSGLTPAEAYEYWAHAYRGFGRPLRDLRADDVTERTRQRFTKAVRRITTDRRPRPLVKVTGWSRIGFLREIFPEARFIHVVRDGRAVANSLVNVEFWEGWRGPQSWRFGPLPPEYDREWRQYDRSFIVLAGIAWKIMMDAVASAERDLSPDSLLTIRYEDLCRDPLRAFREASDFVDLDFVSLFQRRLLATPVDSRNDKWRTDLTAKQQRALNDVLANHLEKFGYLAQLEETANLELD
jgi:hypothetical protein